MGSKNDKKIEIYELDRGVIKSLAGFNFSVRKGADYRVCHVELYCDLVVWGPDCVIISNNNGYQAMICTNMFNEIVLH